MVELGSSVSVLGTAYGWPWHGLWVTVEWPMVGHGMTRG